MSRRTLVAGLILVSVVLAACGGGGTQATGSAGAGNAANGQKLFQQATVGKASAAGCVSCHSTEAGKTLVGPSVAGISTRAEAAIKNPSYKGKAKTTQEFLQESIVEPNTYVEQGFAPNLMPQVYGQQLSGQEINDLVAYLASLK